jgi:hypothetical protein
VAVSVGVALVCLPTLGWADYESGDALEVTIQASAIAGAPPLTVDFEAEATGGTCGSYSYEWSGDVSGTDCDTSETFEEGGIYKATVTVTCGEETASETVEVEAADLLEITDISADPDWGRVPVDVTFEVTAEGGTGSYEYEWGGIASGSDSTDVVTFEEDEDGTYTATVTVTSGSQSRMASVSVTIEVSEEELIEDALELMPGEGTEAVEGIEAAGTMIFFAEIEGVALYDSDNNIIIIREDFINDSSEIIAVILAHEGLHVFYDTPTSLAQELDCFTTAILVWKELKEANPNLHKESFDVLEAIYDDGGLEDYVKNLYPDLQ